MNQSMNLTTVLFLLLYFIFLISSPSIIISSTTNSPDVADQLTEMRLEINQLNRKSGLLELKNVHQDGEIRFLKLVLSKIINNGRQNIDEKINQAMRKRAARLIPVQLLVSRGKEEKPIVGPPSSCKDLNQLGHTLNGIYLIKRNSTSSTNSKIVNVVFCNFQPNSGAQKPSSSSPAFIESRLGYVDVKSADSGIYFHAQISNRSTFPANGLLRFDHLISNVGDGMNLKTAAFTAPKAGVYMISFSILKNGWIFDGLSVVLRLNGAPIGQSMTGSGLSLVPVTLQSTLKLKKGDRIDLWKTFGELHVDCPHYCHHFTGLLVEEDLVE